MTHARKRWIAVMTTAVLAAPLCRYLATRVESMDGGSGLSVLLAPNLAVAWGAMLACLGIAIVFGVAAARICGPRVGMFAAGLALIWSALGMGRLDDILRAATATDHKITAVMWSLSMETLIVGAFAWVGTLLVWRASPDWTRRDVNSPFSAQSAIGFVVTIGVTGALVWLAARSDLPGQTVAACWIGGILGSMIARLAAPRASTLAFAGGIVVTGVIGHAVGAILDGSQAMAASNAGTIWELSRPLPLVYVAAALVAAPGGSAWGRSLTSQAE